MTYWDRARILFGMVTGAICGAVLALIDINFVRTEITWLEVFFGEEYRLYRIVTELPLFALLGAIAGFGVTMPKPKK